METFACWRGLLLTSMFFILIFYYYYYSLPSWQSKCSFVELPFTNTGTTSVSDYQHKVSACSFRCLTIHNNQLTTGRCTAQALTTLQTHTRSYTTFSKYPTPYFLHLLTRSYMFNWFPFPPYWLPVIQCLFCVCFSHCTKCKKQIKISFKLFHVFLNFYSE